MARVELNIVALGDFKSVNSQIAALKAQVDSLNKSLAGTGLSTSLVKDLNVAQAAFKATMLSTGQFTEQTVKLKSETDKFGEALVGGKLKLNEYFNIIRNRSSQATAQMRALAVEQTKLQNSIVMADPTKQGVFSVYTPTKINETAQATKIATNMQNLYNIAVNKGTQSLINWGKNTQWAGRQLTVGLTVPMTMFGAAAMKTFQQVNDELIRLQKVYGSGLTQPTTEALAQVKTQTIGLAKELASSWGVAAKDTAAMAADIAATGKTGTDLIVATREAMRLAKLGELDTQQAMQATISLQNVYKISTQELGGAVNFLNAVENQTSTSLQDLVDGIPRVGPIVEQLGGSFKDTAVMMVAMKEAGVPAAQSANAIKSALASLINPSKAATEAFEKYNINLPGIATATKGNPVQMIMMLQQALKGLEPLAQAQLIEKIFGKYQQARISALIGNLGALNSQTRTAFDLVNASAPQLASLAAKELSVATESTTGKFRRAVETIKADLIPVGEKVMQIATKLLEFGDAVAKTFGNLPGPVKSIFGLLAGGVALAGPLIMLTGVMANFVGYLLKGMFGIKSLVTGTKTLGELLTPNLIASQQAAELFGKGILDDTNAVHLLNQAVRELTISITAMANASAGASVSNATSSIASRLILPGMPGFNTRRMASGGIVPGTGDSDTVPAMLTPGESVVTKQATARYGPVINAMNNGTLTGFKRGVTDVNLAHASGALDPTSGEGLAFMQSKPGLALLEKLFPGSVKILSKLVGPLGTDVNRRMGKPGGAPIEDFLRSFDSQPGMRYAEGAIGGGMDASQLDNPKMQKTMMDFDAAVREKMVALKKSKVTDEDYNRAVRETIAEFAKVEGESKILSESLDKASKTFGGYRTSFSNIKGRGKVSAKDVLSEMQADTSIPLEQRISGTGSGQSGFYLDGTPVLQQKRSGDVAGYSGSSEYAPDVKMQKAIAKSRAALKAQVEETKAYLAKEGKTIAQLFGDGFEAGVIDSIPGLRKVVDTYALTSVQEVEKVLQMASPSRWLRRIGRMFGLGFEQGIVESTPGVVSAADKMGSSAATATSRTSKMKGFLKGPGGMMAGSMGMMAGSMALSSAPNFVGKDMLQSAMSMGSMGMIFGPWGAAAGAAIGLVTSGIGKLIAKEKEQKAMAESVFKSSGDIATYFGNAIVDTDTKVSNFTMTVNSATDAMDHFSKGSSVSTNEIAKFKEMVDSLPKDNPLNQLVAGLTNEKNPEKIKKLALAFVDMQVAIGNIKPDQAQKTIDLILSASNHYAMIGSVSSTVKTQSDAVSATLKNAAGNSKQLGESLITLTAAAANSSSLEQLKSIVEGIAGAGLNASTALNAMYESYMLVGNIPSAMLSRQLATTKNAADSDLGILQRAFSKGFKLNFTESTDMIKVRKDIMQFYKDHPEIAEDKNTVPGVSGLSKASSLLKSQNTLYEAQIKSLEKKKKIVDDELKAQQKITDQLKKQHDFEASQADLQTQIKEAEIRGNYLQAANLKQQKINKAADFYSEKKLTPLEDQSAKLEAQINKIKDKIDANNTAIDKNTKAVDAATVAYSNSNSGSSPGGGGATVDKGTGTKKDPYRQTKDYEEYLKGLFKKDDKAKNDTFEHWNKTWQDPAQASSPSIRDRISDYAKTLKQYKPGDNFTLTGLDGKLYQFKINEDGRVMRMDNGTYPKTPGTAHPTRKKKAMGGLISGPGTGTSDSISASIGFANGGMLNVSNGEYIQRASAVSKYGVNFMDSINTGSYNPDGAGVSNNTNNITVNVNGAGNTDPSALADIIAKKVLNTISVTNAKNNKTNKVGGK